MKNLLLILLLAITCSQAAAQQKPNYAPVKDGTPEQNIARANEAALQAANYLLSMPPDTTNEELKKASGYMIMWMSETEEYSFELDNAGAKLYGGNTSLLSILLAGMVQYQINNPEYKDDLQKVRLNAAQTLIKYAKNPANKIVMHDDLRKADIADKKGELAKYLASFDE